MAVVSSAASTVQNATISSSEWWIKDYLDPANNMLVHIPGDDLNLTHAMDSATFRPVGRRDPVVISDVVRTQSGKLTFEFLARADRDAFFELYERQSVYLLQSGWLSVNLWIKFNTDWDERILNTDPALTYVTIGYVEVQEP